MVKYRTTIKNFNEKVLPYLGEIKLEDKINKGKYDFMITVKGTGVIECHNPELKDIVSPEKGLVFLDSIACSEEIKNKLKELTK